MSTVTVGIAEHRATASSRTILVLLAYLALLAAGELAVTFVHPLLVFPFHGGLIALAAFHLGWLERHRRDERPSPALVALLLAFIIAPLIRIISLTLPLTQIEPPYRYLFAGVPMTIGAILVARAVGFTRADIGLVWRAPLWQIAIVVLSIGLGFMEYLILQPQPLGPLPWVAAGILPALAVGLATGFPEELIFRGVMQTAARPVIGRWNWIYISAIFAVLHIGYASVVDLLFVFGVGLLYGWVFERTRSLAGVTIGHGTANVVLFFVAPNVIPPGTVQPLAGEVEIGAGIGAAVAGVIALAIVYAQRRRRPRPLVAVPVERPQPRHQIVLPGRRLAIPLRTRGDFSASSTEVIETKATGFVLLESENTVEEVTVAKGTRLVALSGAEFVTTAKVVVPRASFRAGPGVARAAIEAVAPGQDSNVAAGRITGVPDELTQSLVSAWNPQATSGGSQTVHQVVSRADYARAMSALQDRLADELGVALQKPTRYGLTLFPDSARLGELSAIPRAEDVVGQEADWFELTLTATARVTAFDRSELHELARAHLRAAVHERYELVDDTVEIASDVVAMDGSGAAYAVEASGSERGVLVEPVGPLTLTVVAVTADETAASADPHVTAERVELSFETSGQFPATGSQTRETRASGSVEFRSENTLRAVSIPAGTRLETRSGIQFATTEEAVLPPASFASGPTTTRVRVEAMQAGPEGNVPPGSITGVPDDLAQQVVSVASETAMEGGTRQYAVTVTTSDYEAAIRLLTNRLEQQLAAAMESPPRVDGRLTLFPASATRRALTPDPPLEDVVGSAASLFTVTLRATVAVTAVDESQIERFAVERLQNVVSFPNELEAESPSVVIHERAVEGETVTYTVEVSGRQRARTRPLDPVTLNAVVGARAPEIRPLSAVPVATARARSRTLTVTATARPPEASPSATVQQDAGVTAARS